MTMTAVKKDQSIILTESMNVRLGSLYQDRKRFSNYPPFQRDKVWGLRMKQVFIDSILRKLPINACMLMEDTDETGAGIYQVIDGQQRLETIFEFLENGFATMKEQEAQTGLLVLEPIEPGCKFKELTHEAQNRFQDYKLPMITFAKQDEDALEEIFLRTNNQEPLSVGEQLFIRNSKARKMALALLKHDFWHTLYNGRTLRKDDFQSALHVITIEILSFPVLLRISHHGLSPLNKLILGEYDSELTDTLHNTIWQRLTEAMHVFQGAKVHSKRDIIPVYEACILLKERNFDLLASSPGCLTDWYIKAKRGTTVERVRNYHPFARIDHPSSQKDFWELETEVIQHVPGLTKKQN